MEIGAWKSNMCYSMFLFPFTVPTYDLGKVPEQELGMGIGTEHGMVLGAFPELYSQTGSGNITGNSYRHVSWIVRRN